ncbi:MAG TPA: putative Ig domain-containing protein [Steroidobacteraceae bacterium]|jgi:hypothetical protein
MFIVTRALRSGATKIILAAACALCMVSGIATAATNSPPTISGTPPTTAVVGTTYSFIPKAKDANGDVLNFGIVNKPSWASFSYSTGQIYGKPTKAGTWSNIQINVWDGKNGASLAKFTITAKAASGSSSTGNRAPTISGSPPASVTAGSAYSFRPTAADPDRNTLGFSIQNRPSWLSFNSSTGQVYGTTSSSNVGTFSNIVIAVSDGKLTTKLAPFSITVKGTSSASNTAPKISGSPLTSIKAGSAYSFTPTASDANKDSLTFSIANKPSWATFSTANGKLSGTPTAAQVGSYGSVTIKVSDGKAAAALPAFSINVLAAGSATGTATLSWTPPTQNTDGTTLTNLSGYRIYYGTSSSALNQTIQVSGAGMSRYVVDDLAPATYYFAVKAVTSAGTESSLSNVASKKIN